MKNILDTYLNDKFKNYTLSEKKLEVSSFNEIENFDIIKHKNLNYILNLENLNNVRRINKFLIKINEKLNYDDLYITRLETLEQKRLRFRKKYFSIFRYFIVFFDFLFNRVFPKMPFLKNIYFFITKGRSRVISKTESIGRFISTGFEIVEYFEYKDLFYIVAKKIKSPDFNANPSYGLLFKMKRVGYNGEIIHVYKIRTMHPYSEYCQDFIMNENNLDHSGKILNDYRVTTWGKFLRKFWLDELPMIINLIKGDINLIGVRPISNSYFKKYPIELQKLRVKIKPGLLPPYYADLPKNFDEILLSEKKYIETKIKHPIKTDIKYLFLILWNILIKGARSK